MIEQDHHAALDDVQFLLEAHPELISTSAVEKL